MTIEIILAFVIIAVGANYAYPAWEHWQQRRAADRRVREVLK
jgi:Tfp pilus assembly protein PilE